MYSCSVEKKSLLCYPFEYHVTPFIQEDPSHRGRSIVSPGARYLAPPKIVGFPSKIFYSRGKYRHWSGIFCIFHDFVYYHHKQTVCKKTLGMARKWDFAANTGPDCDRDLSVIGWLRSTRTRCWIPFKQPCHCPDDVWHFYPYNPFGSFSSSIC